MLGTRNGFDQADHRREQGDDDEADDKTEDDDHDGFEHADQRADQNVHVAVIVVGYLDEHLIEIAGLFADVDHVDDDGVANLGGAERVGHRFAFADGVVNFGESAGIDFVTAGFLGDVDRIKNRHAGADESAERSREAGDGQLADDAAHDRDAQLDRVQYVSAAGAHADQARDQYEDDREAYDVGPTVTGSEPGADGQKNLGD